MSGVRMETPGLEEYLNGLNKFLDNPEWDALYEDAVGRNIPVIRKETARLLYFMLKLAAPKRVLEIGTGSGYSTLWIRQALPAQSELVSLERDDNRHAAAMKLFGGIGNTKILHIDAFDYLREETGVFDAVFLDSQKRDYIALVKILEKRIPSGGILAADNIWFGGRAVREIPGDGDNYKRGALLLREFNAYLASGGVFESVFLPVDDGIVIARKI